MVDTIEGEVIEAPPDSAVAVIEPREMLAETITPEGTVSLATRMATALKDIVEKQKLYAVIQGKKFPQVEAWMTIARMDNVVAREVIGGIFHHDDGSFEATVELIRLSDGMVIGRGSALCGSKGDKPWDARPDPAKRSMAVTRATSRAFRQQYSWIMALAGYEATPAEEMAQDQRPPGSYDGPPDRPELERRADGLQGTVTVGKSPCDLEVRQTPDGPAWGFKLAQGRKGYQALAIGPLAETLAIASRLDDDFIGTTVTVWGRIEMIPWAKDGKAMLPYARIAIERVSTPDWVLPAEGVAAVPDPDDLRGVPTSLGESVMQAVVDDDLSDLDF